MGKPEAPVPQRFRRKHKNTDSASASSSSDSSHSPHDAANHFLYSSLLEEGPASPIMLAQNSLAPPKRTEANGTHTRGDTPVLPTANGVAEVGDQEAPPSLTMANEEAPSPGVGRHRDPPLLMGGKLVQPCPPHPAPRASTQSSAEGADPPQLPELPPEPDHLPPELRNLPHSDMAPLASDQSLSLSCCRVHREDALVLVLQMSNACGAALLDVSVELQCHELKVP